MNNPFASNRNIFNNIIKPRVEGDKQVEGNNNSNNGSSNTIGHTKTYSNINSNANGNNFGGGGSNVNMNSASNLGGGKIDLNFRNQFRTSAISNTNNNNNPNTTSINDNNQPKLISDKQYPAYQPQSSGVPSLSIPNQSNTNITNTKYNTSNMNMNMNTSNNINPNINTNSYQSIGSSKFGMQSQQGVVSGVQRQKFTFGVGSVSGDNSNNNKLEYDRSKFVNREEFTAMPSSNTNYNMGNMGVIRQSSTNPITNTPNNNMMMST